MLKAIKLLSWCVLGCALTVGGLRFTPDAFANLIAPSEAQPNARTSPPTGNIGVKIGAAQEQALITNAGPRDEASYKAGEFIDMARLVLESSRDQAAMTAAFIERATTVIIVFFTLLGVGGALLGWHKLRDMEESAGNAIKQFNSDLEQMRQGASGLSVEFSQTIESTMGQVRKEMLDRIELLSASAEIAHANNTNVTDQQKNQLLATAAKKLELVLNRTELNVDTKIRGMADLAYAKKRLGDVDKAFSVIEDAATLAKQHAPEMYPLLAYNAACYSALLERAEAADWLTKAISEKIEYRDNACADSDFLKVRDSEWFKKITAK